MIRLILSKPESTDKDFFNSVKFLKNNIILVLSSKPYYQMKSSLDKACNNKSCLFLDTISPISQKDVIYLPAENLTALSIAINQAQQSFQGKVTLVFDSVTNLYIKNDSSTLLKFFSFILTRSRDWNADLVFILPKAGVDEKLVSIIKQSADKIDVK